MEKNTTTYDVSRETIDKLKTYEASLNEWQNKFNLVSSSSLADGWNRRFSTFPLMREPYTIWALEPDFPEWFWL